jgi:DNA helicase-2/ATP-dependent DNA helicase PcrA
VRAILTREQRAVVACDARALAVHAGAGTGKTLTLAHRVARLGCDPRSRARLLVVTFTRDATASLQRRLGPLMGRDHGVRVLSFHQWAARELPAEQRRFLDEAEARRILDRLLRREAGLARALGREEAVARAASLLGFAKNREIGIADALRGAFAALAPFEEALVALQEAYEARKGDRLDYDDVPIAFRDRLRRSRAERSRVAEPIDHLFVDEYQDVNGIQAETVRLLTTGAPAPGVTVVGDARQAIYGFRGAAPTHLARFAEAYPLGVARTLALTTSFRAARRLVAAANRLTAAPACFPMRAAPRARLGTEPSFVGCADAQEEARVAADRLESWLRGGGQPDDVAVLARARFLAEPLLEELLRRSRDDAWVAENGGAIAEALDRRGANLPGPAERLLERRARGGEPVRRVRDRLAALRPTPGLDRIVARTIHAAKGLEWDHVLLVGAREGGLPSDQALRVADEAARAELLAEERRLLYVALTRARRSFVATWCGRPSRFLASVEATPSSISRAYA